MKGQDQRLADAFTQLAREGWIVGRLGENWQPQLVERFKQVIAQLGGGCFSIKGRKE